MTRTLTLGAVVIALTLSQPAHAAEPWTPDDVHEAMRTASPRAQCVVTQEIGGRGFDPYAVGAQGELGPVQLHPQGLLNDFYRKGGTDPFSPYQAILYFEAMDQAGVASQHWPTLAAC